MGLTLSHVSALDALRMQRSQGLDINKMHTSSLWAPCPWVGRRWTMREFVREEWQWPVPGEQSPLDILVPKGGNRIRMRGVSTHYCSRKLPPNPLIWLDKRASMVCPELLFAQMGSVLSFDKLVMLGYELCGNFSRSADDPLNGPVVMEIVPATSVERLRQFMGVTSFVRGTREAMRALEFVVDGAVSAPEAVLATMYSLPMEEDGYGLGPVTLNTKVDVGMDEQTQLPKHRYPDLMFSFAPVGINYDGEKDHLDLKSIVAEAQKVALADPSERLAAIGELERVVAKVRSKVVDDLARTRELAAKGLLVFPATKENLASGRDLDLFTRQMLECAQNTYAKDLRQQILKLEDTDARRERDKLLRSLLPGGLPRGESHGRM